MGYFFKGFVKRSKSLYFVGRRKQCWAAGITEITYLLQIALHSRISV